MFIYILRECIELRMGERESDNSLHSPPGNNFKRAGRILWSRHTLDGAANYSHGVMFTDWHFFISFSISFSKLRFQETDRDGEHDSASKWGGEGRGGEEGERGCCERGERTKR